MKIVGVWMLQPGITHLALCERIADKPDGRIPPARGAGRGGRLLSGTNIFDIDADVIREP